MVGEITLQRFSYALTETEGRLLVGDHVFPTIERPWKDNLPFESCIPDGEYELRPWKRPSGDEVYILKNPALNVNHYDKADGSRFLILIHAANFAEDVNGCIAPGHSRNIIVGRRAVTSSRVTMKRLRRLLGNSINTLIIEPALGANL